MISPRLRFHALTPCVRVARWALVCCVALTVGVTASFAQSVEPQRGAEATEAADGDDPDDPTTDANDLADDSAEAQTADPAGWWERIRFSGDFRSRYEGFYEEGRAARNRTRLRLRLRLDTEINEDTRFGLQVASGDPGTPVSTNQTFTSFFRPKPFNLDRAFVAYNPRAASAMTLGLGKFTFPQTRTQMIFDDDLNYEGGWEQVSWNPSDRVGISLGALQTAVNEVSGDQDTYMLAGYGEVRVGFGAHSLAVSAADYGWGNVDPIAVGRATGPLRSILTNDVVRDPAGNIVGFASRFNVVDVIAEATFQTGRPGYPVRVLAEFARNTRAANDRDTGFWIETEYGAPRAAGTWGATYTYGWIEQDMSLSAFVFSDMPGTNLRLHMVETSWMLLPGLSWDITLHFTKRLFLLDDQPNAWRFRPHVAVVVRF